MTPPIAEVSAESVWSPLSAPSAVSTPVTKVWSFEAVSVSVARLFVVSSGRSGSAFRSCVIPSCAACSSCCTWSMTPASVDATPPSRLTSMLPGSVPTIVSVWPVAVKILLVASTVKGFALRSRGVKSRWSCACEPVTVDVPN